MKAVEQKPERARAGLGYAILTFGSDHTHTPGSCVESQTIRFLLWYAKS
jgi:hypothetical protein